MCFRVRLLGVVSYGGRKGSMTFSLETENKFFIYICVCVCVCVCVCDKGLFIVMIISCVKSRGNYHIKMKSLVYIHESIC
jgi:hypothetical protein